MILVGSILKLEKYGGYIIFKGFMACQPTGAVCIANSGLDGSFSTNVDLLYFGSS